MSRQAGAATHPSWGEGGTTAPPLRVLVVADDPLARAGLAHLLAGEPGFLVAAQADTLALSTVLEAGAASADLAVWDTGTAAAAFLDRLGDLGEDGPPALALLPDDHHAAEARAAGARALLYRDVEPDRLAAALRALARGLAVFEDSLLAPLVHPRPAVPTPPDPLTPRELEVVQLLAEGLSNRRIAESLAISEHTAKFHVNSIVTKLGAQSRTDAAVRAARLGLVIL